MAVGVQLVILVILVTSTAATITVGPSDETVQYGEDIQLTCISDNAGEFTQWRSPQNVVFWDSSGDVVSDSNKYERTGSGTDYSMKVKSTDWEDAGPYICETTGVGGQSLVAQLVVMEEPDTIASAVIPENEQTSLRCRVYYAGELMANLDPDHVTQLESLIGDTTQVTNETRQEYGYCSEEPCSLSPSVLTQDFNYKGSSSDNGKHFTCWAYTVSPSFSLETNMELVIEFPPRQINFSPANADGGTFDVGDYINCTADSEPEADITWTPVESSGGTVVTGSELEILSTMVGDNTWECKAWNRLIVDPEDAIVEMISFVVIEGSGNEGESSDGGSSTNTTAIVVGVLVPIIIIAIIVLVVLFVLRRRKQKQQQSSAKEPYDAYPSGGVNPAVSSQPDPTMTQTPPPAGYPVGYTGPGAPRDSPGYGDLGIKHINGSYPIVNPNISFDESFVDEKPKQPQTAYSNEVYDQSPKGSTLDLSPGQGDGGTAV